MRPVSRRSFLAGVSGATLRAAGRGTRLNTPRDEFKDELTEREMFRLTDPKILHHLPAYHHRFLAKDNSFLLLAAEHSGGRQIYRLELKRKRLTQLTDGPEIHSYSPHLNARGRAFFYLQGNELHEAAVGGGGRKTHFTCPEGWNFTGDLGVSPDDRYAAVVEMKQGHRQPTPERQFARKPQCRIRVISLAQRTSSGSDRIVAEERHWLANPQFRPRHSQLLYAREGPPERVENRLRLTSLDGKEKKNLRPIANEESIGREYWTLDGSHVRYVHYPDSTGRRATIRSVDPDTLEETVNSTCSAFGWFDENVDGSAIVGASKRLSGPNVYVLFPSLQREITLCEHYSSRKPHPIAGTDRIDYAASLPDPVVSYNSNWMYFVTDREGKPTLYGMEIGDLVETTS